MDSLRESLVSLESAMSDAEKQFHSTLSDYQDQQEKLQKELSFYQETESALNDARKEYDTVKCKLGNYIEELSKVSVQGFNRPLIFAKFFSVFWFQAKEDSQTILEENLKLKERLGCLNEEYATCEQSSRVAQENVSTLERTVDSQHAEIQQLNQRLETSSAELTNVQHLSDSEIFDFYSSYYFTQSREEVTNLSKEIESLRCQTNSWKNRLSASEEKFQLELTKTQQELSCERVAHSETKVSAMAVFNEIRNILEIQVKELRDHAIVAECENDTMKKERDGEREVVWEEKLCWELCKDQLEACLHVLSAELYKVYINIFLKFFFHQNYSLMYFQVRSTIKSLNNENNSLKCQVNGLQENINVSDCQIESSKRELQNERALHSETKSNWKHCKDQLENEKKEHSINLLKVSADYALLNFVANVTVSYCVRFRILYWY